MSGTPPQHQVTQLLTAWQQGDENAMEALVPLVYRELHRLAENYLWREGSAATLQPTALVNEAYLRLVAQSLPDLQSRTHFVGVAAHIMRQILVDHARKTKSAKRGGDAEKFSIEEERLFSPERSTEFVALDDALNSLAKLDPRKARIVELRFFGGLSVEETAQAIEVSVPTIVREQRLAEAWLHRELSAGAES